MTSKDSTAKRIGKSALTAGGALAVAFVPQYCSADIVTVGGDGGIGSSNTFTEDGETNLGGVLLDNLSITFDGTTNYVNGVGLFPAVRSSVSTSGFVDNTRGAWTFSSDSQAQDGAVLNSNDNWVPGFFSVDGVNGGENIWGWLQVGLGSGPEASVTFISFTYDDEATDTTAFAKPIGGFSVATAAVPEPSSLSLLALLAMGAGAMGRYRKESAVAA